MSRRLTKQEWRLLMDRISPVEVKPPPVINPNRVFAYAIRDSKRERINSLHTA